MNIDNILTHYLCENVNSIIYDYTIGPEDIFKKQFKKVIKELSLETNEVKVINKDKIFEKYKDIVSRYVERFDDVDSCNDIYINLKLEILKKKLKRFVDRIFSNDEYFSDLEYKELNRIFQYDVTHMKILKKERKYECKKCSNITNVNDSDDYLPIDTYYSQQLHDDYQNDYQDSYYAYDNSEFPTNDYIYSKYVDNYCNICDHKNNIIYKSQFNIGDHYRDYKEFVRNVGYKFVPVFTPYDMSILLKRLNNKIFNLNVYINVLYPCRKILDCIPYNKFPNTDIQSFKHNCLRQLVATIKYKKFIIMKENLINNHIKVIGKNREFVKDWEKSYDFRYNDIHNMLNIHIISIKILKKTLKFVTVKINYISYGDNKEVIIKKQIKKEKYKVMFIKKEVEIIKTTDFDVEYITIGCLYDTCSYKNKEHIIYACDNVENLNSSMYTF